jgi:hypothetical protein
MKKEMHAYLERYLFELVDKTTKQLAPSTDRDILETGDPEAYPIEPRRGAEGRARGAGADREGDAQPAVTLGHPGGAC